MLCMYRFEWLAMAARVRYRGAELLSHTPLVCLGGPQPGRCCHCEPASTVRRSECRRELTHTRGIADGIEP